MVYRMPENLEISETTKEASVGHIHHGEEVVPETRPLALSCRDSQVFVEALSQPQPVNERLRATVRAYRNLMGR